MRVSGLSHPADPARDMALTGEILRAVAAAGEDALTRVFVPGPTVAFGRRDQNREGFEAARTAARRHGFVPVVRHGGGRAVAYDAGSVIVEAIRPEARVVGALEPRFAAMADLIVAALTELGVGVQMGELPGEYCPGRFSLHLVDGPKVVGMAQRVISGACLTTASITVSDSAAVRDVLVDVYAALELELDPATVGAIADAHPAVAPAAVRDALVSLALGWL